MMGNFLGNVKKPHFYVKTAVATIWTTFGNIWATFYSNFWSHWCQTGFCFADETVSYESERDGVVKDSREN